MKKLFLTYILPCLSLLLVSCQDDFLPKDYQNSGEDQEGSMMISFMIEDPSIRTRVVDMTPGTAVYIDKVWVGIYDRETGTRVGGTKLDDRYQTTLDHRLTATQVKIPNAIPIEWYATASSLTWNGAKERDLCVVCIANYDNPDEGLSIYTDKTGSDKDGKQTLWSALRDADSWEKFIDIAIDCNSDGFTGGKPMLMGYLYQDTNQTTTFTKVDQFKPDGTTNAILLYPTGEAEDKLKYVNAKLTNNLPTGLNMDNYLVKFRRLRSRINVKIKTRDADMTVTSLQYAVFNKPNSIFLAQRRTNRFAEGEYPVQNYADRSMSPNSADVHVNGGSNGDKTYRDEILGYSKDLYSKDGKYEVNWQTPTNIEDFAFDHFENKHWTSRGNGLNKDENGNDLTDIYDIYHNRERNIDNFTFWALAADQADWNNNASYFVLKMGLLDKATGESAEVQYTIHEGFCNDYDGNEVVISDKYKTELDVIKAKAKDFSCVRNTNYTYNIKINNIQDITYHVTGEEGYSNHSNDQLGDTWRMKYFNTTSDTGERVGNRLKANTWDDDHKIRVTADISFADALPKDIAFRIIGEYMDENGNFVPADFCYNFARGDLDGFANLWASPSVNTEYIIDPDHNDPFSFLEAYKDDIALNKIMSLIKVKMSDLTTGFDENDVDEEGYITIYKYIEKLFENEANINLDSRYDIKGFKLASHNYYTLLSNEEAYIRGLYIFDREKAILQGSRISHDGHREEKTDNTTGSSYYEWFHDEDWLEGVASCKIYEINAIEQLPKYLKSTEYQTFYATENEDNNPMDHNAHTYQYTAFNDRKGIQLSSNPSIAFRMIGCDDSGEPYDLCYNLNPADYPDYNGIWPQVSDNTKYVDKGGLDKIKLPSGLEEGMKLYIDGYSMTITQFVSTYGINNNLANLAKIGFQFSKYNHKQVIDPANHMRALYILDKNTYLGHKPVEMDKDNDKAFYKLYAAEQYPEIKPRTKLDINSLGNVSFTKTADAYDILSPYVGTLIIPPLTGFSSDVYYYTVRVVTSKGKVERDMDVNLTNGNFICQLPMSMYLGNNGGSIYIKATPKNIEEYIDSEWSDVKATFTPLTEYSEWKSGEEDWDAVFSKLEGSSDNKIEYTGKFLSFGGNLRKNNNNEIALSGDGGHVSFTVYKPCKITVNGPNGTASNGKNFGIKYAGTNSQGRSVVSGSELFNSNNQMSFVITPQDFEGTDYLTLTLERAEGTATFMKSISITSNNYN